MAEMEHIPKEIMEDWYSILQRPGMSVLATFLTHTRNNARDRLENPKATHTYELVSEARGEMMGLRKVMQFVKKEFDRAAKGDTPAKEK